MKPGSGTRQESDNQGLATHGLPKNPLEVANAENPFDPLSPPLGRRARPNSALSVWEPQLSPSKEALLGLGDHDLDSLGFDRLSQRRLRRDDRRCFDVTYEFTDRRSHLTSTLALESASSGDCTHSDCTHSDCTHSDCTHGDCTHGDDPPGDDPKHVYARVHDAKLVCAHDA